MADFTVAAKEPGEEVIVDLEMRIPTTAMWSWTRNKDTGLANRTAPRSRKKGLVQKDRRFRKGWRANAEHKIITTLICRVKKKNH